MNLRDHNQKNVNVTSICQNKTIFGFKYLIFVVFLLIAIGQICFFHQEGKIDKLWHPLITPLFLTMVFGCLFNFVGNQIPYLNKFGLGFLFCILVPSFLADCGIVPGEVVKRIDKAFFNKPSSSDSWGIGINFAQFFVTIVTVSSILAIDKNLLKKSIVKFIPLTLIALFCSFLLVGGVGVLLDYHPPREHGFISRNPFLDTIVYFCNPLTSGGTNLGITRFQETFAIVFKNKNSLITTAPDKIRSVLIAPLILTRLLAIMLGGILYKLFDKTIYSGHKQLEINQITKTEDIKKLSSKAQQNDFKDSYQNLGMGMMIVFALYNVCMMLNQFLFKMDTMVYLIIVLIFIKRFDLLSLRYQNYVFHLSKFTVTNFTPAALVCFGVATNFQTLKASMFDFKIVIMVLVSLLTVVLVAFLLAKKFGFYPLEASLTAGLCSHSVGSMGHIGIMSTTDRMNLLHFAHIATRIVGPMIFVFMNLVFNFFYNT
ncbi:2-hydroxycarboxylate transporter family protein [Candidatus Phytoplasma meliae]|uniref:2-hydroxycarboxylate transporter family protein n=1 Tax=Candidatus Phytoplasma meliae TaxID=1848402 RepID=A0ABS5CYU3_9MOLU|nr:2-hydroxycarboxylate transporter family protein [Candidatus Phytoplasma meliae]MBP5836148.1 2-hydroxycarboxylate transporter family protein [Candidatus Phytoplasma meliae]MBP5836251.1 2-hydroxycarboxylate transporter family protein [Candidatus Phytoplasma meliae]